MIYRSIPHGESDKTVKERMIPEEIHITEAIVPEEPVSAPETDSTQITETDIQAAGAAGPAEGLININTADVRTLMTLKGIGEKKAQSIVDHRTQNGSFASIDALADVPGIGKKTVEALKPFVTV